ncbi:response regulator transcription factor [Streptomyces mirabilis]|uniref:response regulator transcription factor n=1 Tax=Streptomyces mirabilis TaxID=68239 RepID=UPI0037AB0792
MREDDRVRILIAEDDPRLADLLEEVLTEAGWRVALVRDGRSAYAAALGGGHDVVLLDWMLPGLDGATVCRRLRDVGVTTPVLMLTARGQVEDRIEGLDAGADDYMAKPFVVDELLARLRALHRRTRYQSTPIIAVGDLVIDTEARRVKRGEAEIALTAREFDILSFLAANAGKAVSRYDLYDEVWGETDLRSNVMDVSLASIRAKIDRPFGTSTITTLRGSGYRVELPAT